jgi:hypothetical protein
MKEKEIVDEFVLARVGGKDKEGNTFTSGDLQDASEMDDDLLFDEKEGVLKLVLRKEED